MLHLIFPLLSLNTLLVTTTKEILWLGRLCNDLGFPQADPSTLLVIVIITLHWSNLKMLKFMINPNTSSMCSSYLSWIQSSWWVTCYVYCISSLMNIIQFSSLYNVILSGLQPPYDWESSCYKVAAAFAPLFPSPFCLLGVELRHQRDSNACFAPLALVRVKWVTIQWVQCRWAISELVGQMSNLQHATTKLQR